jgi:hypothetical protein
MTLSTGSTHNYASRQAAEESPFIVPLEGMKAQMRQICIALLQVQDLGL